MTFVLPENWQELMAGYALGDLSPEEAEELLHLLAENPGLKVEVTSLQEVLALVPYALSQQAPSPHLRDRILAVAQVTPQLETPSDIPVNVPKSSPSDDRVPLVLLQEARRRSRWISRVYAAGGVIAASVMFALGIDNYQLRVASQQAESMIAELQQRNAQTQAMVAEFQQQQPSQSAEFVVAALQQRGTQTYALEGTERANAATGSLVVAQGEQAIILVKNLPVLPAGQVYRIWAMPANGKNPIFCGQFNANADQAAMKQWVAPKSAQVAFQSTSVHMLITSEREADPRIPKGTLVMHSRV
ncbi:MAG: hypothetical protein HC772_01405 [Leptolyngbyaceae cyanobacterium CRU_2_3]|nr:hypothetical protein [Leptolyngbyaceae cyanobacterium CRU_2_3]